MSEEEIIEIIEKLQCEYKEQENEKKYNNYTVFKAKEYSKGLQGLLDLYQKEKEKNEELKKYDYRKIKIEEKNKISSIHFTKEQLDLMNLGIALYVGIPKILADTEDEDTDI